MDIPGQPGAPREPQRRRQHDAPPHRRRPQQPPRPTTPSGASDEGRIHAAWITTVAAAAVTVVAAFMTWLSVAWASASGIDGDGKITLAAGIAAGAAAIAARGNPKLWPMVGVLCGAVIVSIGLYHLVNMSGASWENDWFEVSPDAGEGLYLTLLAGVALVVGGILAMAQIGRARVGCTLAGVVLAGGLLVTLVGDPYAIPDDPADDEVNDWFDDDANSS